MLTDELITLRAVEPSDADFMWLTDNAPEMWTYSRRIAPLSRDLMRAYAMTYEADPLRAGQLRLIIEEKKSGKLAGILDLYDLDVHDSHVFVGIAVDSAFRRQGIALHALHLCAEYCRKALGMKNLAAKIAADNSPSIALFEKAGYKKAGTLVSWLIESDKAVDLHIYQLSL